MHTLKLWKSSKIKKSFQTPECSPTFSTPPWGGSQAPSPRCQEASGRTMVLVTVRIRNRLSHRPGADGYVNRLQSYSTFLCPKHEERSWDTGKVWKLVTKSKWGIYTPCTGKVHMALRRKTRRATASTVSQLLNHVQPHGLQHLHHFQASLPLTVSRSLLIHAHWDSDAIQSSHPLPSLLLLLSVFPNTRPFFNELTLGITWPKYWSFSFSISLSNEY